MEYAAFAREGLLLSREVRRLLTDQRAIRRDVEDGTLIRFRRGAYVERDVWGQLSAREKHVLRIRAVQAMAVHPVVAAGVSAAALWGMPISGAWPDTVTVLDRWRGGGRSEPGVHKTARGERTAGQVTLRGIDCTTLARTALDVAFGQSFAEAMGSVDWALSNQNQDAVSAVELSDELRGMNLRVGARHLRQVIGFATPLSGSFGESRARAVIHLLGFETPELQVRFADAEGEMFPDFYWAGVRVAAEFDGRAKYTRDEFTRGDPAQVAWREKKREDRLRRQVRGVVRILTEHVERPAVLERMLLEAGVPRRGRS
jgi:hypothetical protein